MMGQFERTLKNDKIIAFFLLPDCVRFSVFIEDLAFGTRRARPKNESLFRERDAEQLIRCRYYINFSVSV
jgi:hypothetical protein